MAKERASGELYTTFEMTAEHTQTDMPEEIEITPKKNFGLLTAMGVQYSVTGAPIAIGTYLSLAIGLGGSPAYFWGF
ncbi:uncharacterized protein N7498_005991 [Penicillium cinerascens]|uniref:Uncharacterized protein n=1 Tax=Penicillium cinerascens TaxID=70096 RepID=A0A9W9T0R0_9EURO|nr:uncharacterized protein N7498_005991 [Penicillium cinerascens]KAJ5205112.1 hypothetical protein N7498_005991 [Penicillium cinerascens]